MSEIKLTTLVVANNLQVHRKNRDCHHGLLDEPCETVVHRDNASYTSAVLNDVYDINSNYCSQRERAEDINQDAAVESYSISHPVLQTQAKSEDHSFAQCNAGRTELNNVARRDHANCNDYGFIKFELSQIGSRNIPIPVHDGNSINAPSYSLVLEAIPEDEPEAAIRTAEEADDVLAEDASNTAALSDDAARPVAPVLVECRDEHIEFIA
ncbi:hypothetical protein ACOME3_004651 [Neoechinorhynchus agilis]